MTVVPASTLHDGDVVQLRLTGFGVGGKVFLSECASAAAASDLGCGAELAAQPFAVTGDNRTASVTFIVRASAAASPLPGQVVECRDQCVIVATVGAGYGFAIAPVSFAEP